jgi:eukaryotic-like serine/threonine-protein kinase
MFIILCTLQPSYQEEQEQGFTKQYFLVSTLSGLSQPASDSSIPTSINNVSTYQNSSLGINLQYPSFWKVEERTNIDNYNNTAINIKFSSPSKRDLFVVSVYTQNLSSLPVEQQQQNITLDSLTRTGINAAKLNLNDLQFLDLETANVTLGLGQNNQAHKIIYSNTNKNTSFPLQFVTMQTYTIKDSKIYGISYVSEASQFFRHLPVVQRMIDSFQIKG